MILSGLDAGTKLPCLKTVTNGGTWTMVRKQGTYWRFIDEGVRIVFIGGRLGGLLWSIARGYWATLGSPC